MSCIRPMRQADVPAITRLQAECYSSRLQEDEETIRARLLAAPHTAWVADDGSGVCAYLVGYRSALGKVTPLNAPFDVVQSTDTLYLHDLAASSRCRGRGVGTALVQVAWQKAQEDGLEFSALVAVQGSVDFWKGLGYTVWDHLDPIQMPNLETYPSPSAYMVRRLGRPATS